MIEAALNGIWLTFAVGVVAISPRCSLGTRVALLCAVALLFPIISISDDFNADRTFSDAAAIIVVVLATIALVAMAHVRTTAARPYAVLLATPSNPRSPPR